MFDPGAYHVEREVFSGKFRSHFQRPDGITLDEQAALSDRLFAHFGVEPVAYRRRRGDPSSESHANPWKRVITYGALAGSAVVCHEVAHILANGTEEKTEDGYWHGPMWQAKYVACVEVLLGTYHANRLKKAFAKFEADKERNIARAARKRGQRRSSLKSGPRVRTVVKSEISGKFQTRAMGDGVTLAWGVNDERFFAVRYSTNKGGYWMVSGYDKVEDQDYDYDYLGAAKGSYGSKLFTEKQFSTKVEALEWALEWAKDRKSKEGR